MSKALQKEFGRHSPKTNSQINDKIPIFEYKLPSQRARIKENPNNGNWIKTKVFFKRKHKFIPRKLRYKFLVEISFCQYLRDFVRFAKKFNYTKELSRILYSWNCFVNFNIKKIIIRRNKKKFFASMNQKIWLICNIIYFLINLYSSIFSIDLCQLFFNLFSFIIFQLHF